MSRMTREQLLQWFRSGNIPQMELEREEDYISSRRVSAYQARTIPNYLPAVTDPYEVPSAPTHPVTTARLHAYPPSVTLPPGVPTPPELPFGSVEPPGFGVDIRIPGTETVIRFPLPAEAADLCQCIRWALAHIEARFIPIITERLTRAFEERSRNFQQHARSPSHISRPFEGFDATECTTTPVSFSSGFTEIVARTVEQAHNGVIEAIGVELNNPAGFADTEWRVLADGVPIRNFDSVFWRLGSFASPHTINETVPGPARISVEARSISGATYFGEALLKGWDYIPRTWSPRTIEGTLTD